MIALGLILWTSSKLLLVGLLVLLHWGRQKRRSVPAPLFERRTPVSGGTRFREGIFGLVAIYALCAAVSFAAFFGQPMGSSLVLNPVADSPAARAGLAHGDRARNVEGVSVKTFDEFREAVARAPESVSIEVERKGQVVPLLIHKDADNRIGVESLPGETMGATAALWAAARAPVTFLIGWIQGSVVTGPVAVVGPTGVGAMARAGGVAQVRLLALLMSKDLASIALVYMVVLVADTRSRARYQAAQKGAAA